MPLPCLTLAGTPRHGTTRASASPSPLDLSTSLGAPGQSEHHLLQTLSQEVSTHPGSQEHCPLWCWHPPHQVPAAHGTSGQQAQNTSGEVAVFSESRLAETAFPHQEGFQ